MSRGCLPFLLTLLFCTSLCAQAPETLTYADSAEGFRQQLEDFIAARRSGDAAALRAKLDSLAVPDANHWIAARFLPSDVAKLQHDYPLSLAGFQKHFSWVIENAAHLPGWEMKVIPSEVPRPPAAYGKESNVPAPTETVSVENFRYGPEHPEDNIQRSWVNSFVYIDGQFRYVGGTYPFWAEELQGMRGTSAESLPDGSPADRGPKNITSARLIRKIAPEYPEKARKKRVEGTVRLHVLIDKYGTVQNLSVVFGDPLLVKAALKAVQQWRYEPTRVNGEAVDVDTTIDVTFMLNH